MTENNEIRSYDLPDVESITTPAEAAQALSKIYADVVGDPLHPYGNAQHPQGKDFRAVVTKLHEIKTSEDGGLLPMELKMAEILKTAAAEKADRQDKLRFECEQEFDRLEEFGFRRSELPDDIQDFHLRGLREQRMAAEGDFDQLVPLLEVDLRELRAPPDTQAAFRAFIQAQGLDPGLRGDIADTIVCWIYSARKARSQ